MKKAFVILAVLMAHAPLAFSEDDASIICTNDGNCYTECFPGPVECRPAVDHICVENYGRQDLNQVVTSCGTDVVQTCYACYGPPTTETTE